MRGDFRQVVSILRPRTRRQVFDPCVNQSGLWAGVIVLLLRTDMCMMTTAGNDGDLRDFCD